MNEVALGSIDEPGFPPGLVTAQQEGLLAILYAPDDATALDRFLAWQETIDFLDLDHGSYRLYPHLWRRVKDLVPDHPFLGRLKGNYRRTLYRNQLLFRSAHGALATLAGAGIPAIVLKGAASVGRRLVQAGLRPMADVDLLIRPADLPRAVGLLIPQLRPLAADPGYMAGLLAVRSERGFYDRFALEIDLQWRLLGNWVGVADDDDPFWDAAEPGDFQGMAARFLCTTDHFFHVVVHGMQWNPVPSIRWITDAMEILDQTGAAPDWSRAVALAQRYRVALPLRIGLAYLRERFHAAIPTTAIEALARIPIGDRERTLFSVLTRRWSDPVTLDEAAVVLGPEMRALGGLFPRAAVLVAAPDRLAQPATIAWARASGAAYLFDLNGRGPRGAALIDRVRRAIPLERLAERTRTLLLGPDPDDPGGRGRLYVSVFPRPDGILLRAFATDAGPAPSGRLAFRLDNAMLLRKPILSRMAQDADPPLLPFREPFPERAEALADSA